MFKKKRELQAEFPQADDEEVEILIEPQPLAHARQCARQLLQSILDACAPVAEYRGYVTGPGNFRYELATIQPYKGNRDKTAEPLWRRDVEEYLLSDWSTERCTGYEADDGIVMEFVKSPEYSVVASLDKDFLTVEGMRMWNWRKKLQIEVSPVEAHRNFYKQMLTGDAVDAVRGVPGIGAAKAAALIDPMTDKKAMEYATYYAFKKAVGALAWDQFVETGRLLHLLRKKGEVWNPQISR